MLRFVISASEASVHVSRLFVRGIDVTYPFRAVSIGSQRRWLGHGVVVRDWRPCSLEDEGYRLANAE